MNRIIVLHLLLLTLVACDRQHETVRHYTEVGGTALAAATPVQQPAAPFMGGMPAAPQVALAWKTPADWKENPGTGFRLATFVAGEAECAILAFPDAMGGSDAKISMWLSQLGGTPPAPERLISFLANPETITTDGGITCAVYDLTPLLGNEPAQSILAGLITVDGKQIAVRLKGSLAALSAQKAAFRSLCQSLVKK